MCREKNCYFTLRSLLILCPTYLLFMTLIGGLAIPGGLFIPSIMVRSPCLPSSSSSPLIVSPLPLAFAPALRVQARFLYLV